MCGRYWKRGKSVRVKRILPSIVITALINAIGIWPAILIAGEVIANTHAFEVPVSSLKTEANSLFYRGRPLNADNPMIRYQDGQEAMEAARKFPNTLSCLVFEPEDETVSLARLNTESFENLADLEICLQRVGIELGDVSRVIPWLKAIGFKWLGTRELSWFGPDPNDVFPTEYHVLWPLDEVPKGMKHPLCGKCKLPEGSGANNLHVIILIIGNRYNILDVKAAMINY